MADETKTNATPEAPGGPPAPEQTEQAVIPGMDGGPAPSGKVIDLSDVRAEADKTGPEAPPEQGAAGSVTEYTKQEWERPLEEIEAEQKKPRRGRPPKADRAAPEAGEKKTGNPVMAKAHTYVDHWPQAFKRNIGLLLFGDVGTGKSFAAGCIANAFLDRDVPVLMTNFPTILARLCGTFGEDRADFLDSLGDYDLLIIDDLGAERNTEYALEQMFSIIDSRYRCNKPLIVTTNLKLDQLKHPPDLAHARIYDRILERCAPILFAGKNFREDNAASTKAAARQIITSPTASHRQAVIEKGEL